MPIRYHVACAPSLPLSHAGRSIVTVGMTSLVTPGHPGSLRTSPSSAPLPGTSGDAEGSVREPGLPSPRVGGLTSSVPALHMTKAMVYGQTLCQIPMALAKKLCHTRSVGLEALGDQGRLIMYTASNKIANLIHDMDTSSAWTAERGAITPTPALTDDPVTAWLPRADWSSPDVPADNGSAFASPDGQLCGLFAVDIAGFNGSRRDDDIQIYVHKSLYEMLQAAFDRSDVPWFSCAHEDRGDGVLVVIPPMIPVAGLVDPIPERLRRLVRHHNRVSCEAARIQLRVAAHVGPVHSDGHGFVGRDVNLLCRLLDARALKRLLTQSGAEVGFITSGYVYENVIRRRPSLVDPALFQPLSVRVKETRTRAWAHLLGT